MCKTPCRCQILLFLMQTLISWNIAAKENYSKVKYSLSLMDFSMLIRDLICLSLILLEST